MKILFLTPYYPPEVGAPQARIHELAVRLVRRGHSVQVLTALPNYPSGIVPEDYRGRSGSWEELDGVKVFRCWIFATPNKGFGRRVLAHLSFMASAIMAAPQLGEYEVVYVESPPLFDGVAGWALARLRGARMVFNVADLWPQSVVELGMIGPGLLLDLASALEKWCYRVSDLILAVTSGIEQQLKDRGLARKLAWFPNGVDAERFNQGNGAELRRQLGLEGKFVVLYAGTLGLAQSLMTAIEAARLLEGLESFQLVLVGDGAERERIIAAAGPNVQVLPPVPSALIPALLAAADAALVSLRDVPLFRGAVPSKTYEAMAAGRPVIMCAVGEAPALLLRAQAGVVVAPERPDQLAAAIADLAADKGLRSEMGERGKHFVRAHFDRDLLAERFETLIAGCFASAERQPERTSDSR